MDGYEWDSAKAAQNLKKHGVDFADAVISFWKTRRHFPTLIPTPTTRNDTFAWAPILQGGYSSRYTRTEAIMSESYLPDQPVQESVTVTRNADAQRVRFF